AGWLIDVFKASNEELLSIRYAMTVTSLVFIPSILCFLVVSKVLPKDWAAADERNKALTDG
ncbi:MAG: hypothetical protein RI942_217, partial [Pseudomonadota bacterium]